MVDTFNPKYTYINRGIYYFCKAAEHGDSDAQQNLAVAYLEGKGVPRSVVQAYMWFNLCAAQGDEKAVRGRDLTAETMTSSQIEKAQDLARECLKKGYKDC